MTDEEIILKNKNFFKILFNFYNENNISFFLKILKILRDIVIYIYWRFIKNIYVSTKIKKRFVIYKENKSEEEYLKILDKVIFNGQRKFKGNIEKYNSGFVFTTINDVSFKIEISDDFNEEYMFIDILYFNPNQLPLKEKNLIKTIYMDFNNICDDVEKKLQRKKLKKYSSLDLEIKIKNSNTALNTLSYLKSKIELRGNKIKVFKYEGDNSSELVKALIIYWIYNYKKN